MGKALLTEKIIGISVVALSIIGIIVFASESNADEQWDKYYDADLSTYFYDKKSLHYPYKDNQKIIAVWTKIIPSSYITHKQERIGYFLDLIYIDCEQVEYRRTEMLIHSDSGELIKRQMGTSTYYTIDPESEAEALFKKVCS